MLQALKCSITNLYYGDFPVIVAWLFTVRENFYHYLVTSGY